MKLRCASKPWSTADYEDYLSKLNLFLPAAACPNLPLPVSGVVNMFLLVGVSVLPAGVS